jgi:hypothetical protein
MNHVKAIAATFGGLAIAGALTACSTAEAEPKLPARALSISADAVNAADTALPIDAAPVPASIDVPKGNKPVATLPARGVQVYQCLDKAWTLLEPDATLKQGHEVVALHTRGPVWVSTVDGSAVNAAAVPGASVKRENAIPELLLKAAATRGEGLFGKVTFVQRLETKGGLAPIGTCAPGTQVSSPYEATYKFFVAG